MIILFINSSADLAKAPTSGQLRSTASIGLVILCSSIRRVGSFEEEREHALVVAKEDIYESLCVAHDMICHAERFRMWAYLEKHKLHITTLDLELFLRLCRICQEKKEKVTTKTIAHKPTIPPTVDQRTQSDLIDSRMQENNGYKYILNYQDCFSKFIVLRALKTKSAVGVCEHLISIFCEHGAPTIFQTDSRSEFINNMHCSLSGRTHGSYPDFSVDLMQPQELIDSLNTEDDLKNALKMDGEIIEFSTQTTETTAVPVLRSSIPILPHFLS